jgi:predicted enzyme related to lactoylglutathione lyase
MAIARSPAAAALLHAATRWMWPLLALALIGGRSAAADVPGPEGKDGTHYPGKLVWFELVTDQPDAARAFYESVFGWRFTPVPGAPALYNLIENRGTRVAGTFVHTRKDGGARAARWLTLISVPDVAAAVRYATQNGGGVMAAPASIAGRGVHALLRDPDGGLVGVLRTQSGDPPDVPVQDGDFFWADLFAADPARAAQFYSGLAGYEVSPRQGASGRTRLVLQSQGYARAGIVRRPAELKESGWLPYVLVNDVPATLQKATTAGGRVLVAPTPDLLDGNVAVIADPLGGVLGVVNWDGDAGEGAGGGR